MIDLNKYFVMLPQFFLYLHKQQNLEKMHFLGGRLKIQHQKCFLLISAAFDNFMKTLEGLVERMSD